jgi:periplasmic copper chaperone A
MQRLTALAVALNVFLAGFAADAGDTYSVGALTIAKPWARASAGPARAAAAYLTISNGGSEDDRLIAVDAGPVAATATLHTTAKDGDVMRMRHVEGIAVKAGATATLAPGGDHVMLMGLTAPLKEGGRFPLTLTFEKAGPVTVEVEVRAVGAIGNGHGMHRR